MDSSLKILTPSFCLSLCPKATHGLVGGQIHKQSIQYSVTSGKIEEVQNATGAQKRVPCPEKGIQGRLPGESKMCTIKSFRDSSSYHVKTGWWAGTEAGTI